MIFIALFHVRNVVTKLFFTTTRSPKRKLRARARKNQMPPKRPNQNHQKRFVSLHFISL